MPFEPSSEEREAMGIPDGEQTNMRAKSEAERDAELLKYFPTREKFWIERLRQRPLHSVLFVCGVHHVRTFFRRLIEKGFSCRVLCFDWASADEHEHGAIPLEERPI
jgi:hypothetical protein